MVLGSIKGGSRGPSYRMCSLKDQEKDKGQSKEKS